MKNILIAILIAVSYDQICHTADHQNLVSSIQQYKRNLSHQIMRFLVRANIPNLANYQRQDINNRVYEMLRSGIPTNMRYAIMGSEPLNIESRSILGQMLAQAFEQAGGQLAQHASSILDFTRSGVVRDIEFSPEQLLHTRYLMAIIGQVMIMLRRADLSIFFDGTEQQDHIAEAIFQQLGGADSSLNDFILVKDRDEEFTTNDFHRFGQAMVTAFEQEGGLFARIVPQLRQFFGIH